MHSAPKGWQRVLTLIILLFGITYLDRVAISVAGPRMQQDLHIDPIGWGWVTGIFTISYGLFEIPSGMLADRIGPRRVLTRIVLWWSAFTALTGSVSSLLPLLVTRFLFGAGEAGAFPSVSVVVSRWFPPTRRATLCGVALMSGQVGGALAPLIVVPIQAHYGWRASFFVLGALGLCWSIAWYRWFRDSPPETDAAAHSPAVARPAPPRAADSHFPWRAVLRSRSTLSLLGTAFCYVYAYNFFQTWFHTFLVKGREFSEASLLLSALPYIVAVLANFAGGFASDALVRRFGRTRGRRALGASALAVAGCFTIAALLSHQQLLTVVFLTVVYGAITFQQSGVFGVCLDIGREHGGAMVGLMNTSAQAGGLIGAVAYGYIVDRFGSYDAPFVPMAALLFVGALLWLWVDAADELHATPRAAAPAPGA